MIDRYGLARKGGDRRDLESKLCGRPRRLHPRALAATLGAILTAMFLILAPGAGAELSSVTTFGGTGRGAGEFEQPGGIAISPDGEHIYVADTDNNRIEEFSPTGQFERTWGWGVKDGTSVLQTCTENCFRGQGGQFAGELNEPIGVAVAADGTVYAINRAAGDGRILKFDATQEPGEPVVSEGSFAAGYGPGTEEEAGFTFPLPLTNDLAVDPEDGTVYVADNAAGGPRIVPFDPATGAPGTPIPVAVSGISAIAAGPGGRLYVGQEDSGTIVVIEGGQETERLNLEGDRITAFAVDPATGNFFAEQRENQKTEAAGRHLEALLKLEPDGRVIEKTITEVPEGRNGSRAYGLAFDPTVQVGETGVIEPGAVYFANPVENNVTIFGAPAAGEPTIYAIEPPLPLGTEGEALRARVNPRGHDTKVYFQYGTTALYGSAVPAIDIGSGFGIQTAVAQLSGLQPGTAYHYRVVAVSEAGTTTSEDLTFTTRSSVGPFALPDGRAWEQVTTEKGNSEVLGTPGSVGAVGASPDGSAVGFVSLYPLAGTPGANLETSYVAFRGSTGWQIKAASPPTRSLESLGLENPTILFSRDLSRSVGFSLVNIDGNAHPGFNLYLRDNLTGSETLMTPYRGARGFSPIGSSADLEHFFFTSSGHLTPDTPEAAGNSLYEWSGGVLRNIGILPGSSTPTTSSIEIRPLFGNPVSEDGSRVFFTIEPPGEARQLYVRIDGSRTLQVSAAQTNRADSEATTQRAEFVGASKDGRFAFFTSSAALTEDAYTGEVPLDEEGNPEPKNARNLYRFDTTNGQLVDLTVADDQTNRELGANVDGGVLVAGDGQSAYFVAGGRLARGAPVGGANLYRWTEGAGTTLVATLHEGDEPTSPGGFYSTARTTADGSVLAFTSRTPLDPAFPGVEGREIYRYAAGGGAIACVSCDPTATEQFETFLYAAGGLHAGNALSADGSRVFFETVAPLATNDVNGKPDVYEWEGGSAHLISSGTGRLGSTFLDASASGDDVFFVTNDRLVAGDQDQLADVYDARVGGGFPEPSAAAPPCEGETCLPAVKGSSATGTIGSRSINGPSDPKRKRHHKKHPKKHHKKHGKHRQHKRSQGHPAVGKRG